MAYKRLSPAAKLKSLPAKYTQRVSSWDLDWRSPMGIQVMSELLTLAQDLGGWDELSRMEQILVERATFLSLKVSEFETAMLAGEPTKLDAGVHSNYCNVLSGILSKLGLKRRSKPVRSLREVMSGPPSLHLRQRST
jgi:hypothetical protein